jgi:hypothetical protein
MGHNNGYEPNLGPRKRKVLPPGHLSPAVITELESAKIDYRAEVLELNNSRKLSKLQVLCFDKAITLLLKEFGNAVARCISDLGSDWFCSGCCADVDSSQFRSRVRVVEIPGRSELELDIIDVVVQTICFQVQHQMKVDMLVQITQELDTERTWAARYATSLENHRAKMASGLVQVGPISKPASVPAIAKENSDLGEDL